MQVKNNELIIKKSGVDYDQRTYSIRVSFEKNPIVLRGVEIYINDEYLKLSIYNHSYNEEFDRNFFKLINPKFLN